MDIDFEPAHTLLSSTPFTHNTNIHITCWFIFELKLQHLVKSSFFLYTFPVEDWMQSWGLSKTWSHRDTYYWHIHDSNRRPCMPTKAKHLNMSLQHNIYQCLKNRWCISGTKWGLPDTYNDYWGYQKLKAVFHSTFKKSNGDITHK